MTDYVGNTITPVGRVQLRVTHDDKTAIIWVYVVQRGGPPLLGRNDLATLGINNISTCNFTTRGDFIDSILDKYKNVFDEGLGTFSLYEVSLKIKPNTAPKFFKHRPVLLALKEKVEKEIGRLATNKILITVDHSGWATPVVPILKGDGAVRLCGDFKITVNPVLIGTEYPLTKI